MATRTLVLLLCSVTFASCYRTGSGTGSGSGGTTATSPIVAGLARYYDLDRSSTPNVGDRVVVPFNAPVSIGATDASALELAVLGDLFGPGAVLVNGPEAHEITIVLADGAALKTRQEHSPGQNELNSPSGIDVSPGIAPGAIADSATGATVEASLPIDIVPGLVAGPQVSSGPASDAAQADIDLDGIMDLVVARSNGGFEVWQGAGDGTFHGGLTSGAAAATAMAVADLNNDGRMDVVIGTEGNDQVWLGAGTPVFTGSTILPVLEHTSGLALADLDRDGDLDIIAAGQDALRVHLNDGSGAFPSDALSYGQGCMDVAAGDFDRDGDVDLITARDGANQLWSNDGMAGLVAGATLGEATTRVLAVADVDLDGDLDIMAGNSGSDRLWLGNGAGMFEVGQTFPASITDTLAFGDLDQDARPDLFAGGANKVRVLLNDYEPFDLDLPTLHGGTFDPVDCLVSGPVSTIVTGDWNCDGDLDLAVAMPTGGTLVYEGSLAGTWGTSTLMAASDGFGEGGTFSLATEDLDRDGDLDLAAGKAGRADLFMNTDGETFDEKASPVSILAGRVTDMVFADIDSDGDRDLVLTRREGLLVFMNDGTGNFEGLEPTHTFSNLSAVSVALDLGDVDSDGDLDAVVGNQSGPDTLYLNPGPDPEGWAGFDAPVRLPQNGKGIVRTATNDLGLVDVDTDGDLDLVLVQHSGGPARVYRNTGTGIFLDTNQQLATGSARSLAIDDVDLDGDKDLVIGTQFDGVVPWLNDGTGQFTPLQNLAVGYMRRVALRDLDGDKFPEILALRGNASGAAPAIFLWHNDGGAFTQAAITLATQDGQDISLGDFDLDGDTDVIFGFAPLEASNRAWWNR